MANDGDRNSDARNSTNLRHGRSRYQGKCFDCKECGHMNRDCPLKKKGRALLADAEEEPTLL